MPSTTVASGSMAQAPPAAGLSDVAATFGTSEAWWMSGMAATTVMTTRLAIREGSMSAVSGSVV
ncbi:hypothetical protein PG996_006099 [Apiospora saccharicola]|uniref:Uncharacterized protein n=1 Tax=Apiospora saccharicola TaxID=335842 RepID=A0ABR1VNC0_9PEZI